MPVDLTKVREHGQALQKEARERTIGFITAGLGLVAGLAWNDAIKALIDYLYPLDKDSVSAKFIYAALVTLVVVLLSTYLVRLLKKDDQKSHTLTSNFVRTE